MVDIVERLNAFKTRDHERLCQGREYVCSCGYDADLELAAVDAAAEITALRARAEAAEKERDELRSRLDWAAARSVEMFDGLLSKFQASETLLSEAKAALEPFASKAARYADIAGIVMTSDNVELWQVANRAKPDLTVGDLRAAAALVKKLEDKQ